jgi:hypothetical protein
MMAKRRIAISSGVDGVPALANAGRWKRDPRLGVPSERHEMQKLAEYLDLAIGPFGWLHVPNEGKRSARTGADLKRQGMKPGAPDVLIFTGEPQGKAPVKQPPENFRTEKMKALGLIDYIQPAVPLGFAIELKREGATISALTVGQKLWGREFGLTHGWTWFAAAGADAAIRELKRIGFP